MKKLLVYFVNLWDYVASSEYPFSGFNLIHKLFILRLGLINSE